MNSRRELVWVGIFVLIALVLLIGTILAVAGTFSAGGITHRAYFKSAGGLVSGATVRYGGMKAGRVEAVRVDPQDSTRIEVDFTVARNIPVKTDSVAKITSLGALSDNYVEVGTGTKGAPLAPPGSELKSVETIGVGDLADMIGRLEPVAQQVLQNLNQRLTELQVTIARVDDVLNDTNRENINKSLETLAHVDSVVVENRQDIRAVVVELKQSLVTASALIEELKNTMDNNTDNIDQIMVNLRVTTENVRELTDELKTRPSALIRGNNVKDRKPGGKSD
jgi:phospholipid/cholesterol/gamma-HCH transport system substrate-binding protein